MEIPRGDTPEETIANLAAAGFGVDEDGRLIEVAPSDTGEGGKEGTEQKDQGGKETKDEPEEKTEAPVSGLQPGAYSVRVPVENKESGTTGEFWFPMVISLDGDKFSFQADIPGMEDLPVFSGTYDEATETATVSARDSIVHIKFDTSVSPIVGVVTVTDDEESLTYDIVQGDRS